MQYAHMGSIIATLCGIDDKQEFSEFIRAGHRVMKSYETNTQVKINF